MDCLAKKKMLNQKNQNWNYCWNKAKKLLDFSFENKIETMDRFPKI